MRIDKLTSSSRIKLGLSQAQLASRAGVGTATIQNIERNIGNPALKTIEAIFAVLRIRIKFEVEAVETDWSTCARLGCPLTENPSAVVPTSILLIESVNQMDCQKLKNREAKAVSAWLQAVRDHYPSVWQKVNYATRAWVNNQTGQPKLRRIALNILGEYL
jgi:transcriptional regulator with XRE-family HTH domain